MKKWRVTGVVSGGKYLGEFEADTEDEATDMALESEAAYVSLCHHCADQVEDPVATSVVLEEV